MRNCPAVLSLTPRELSLQQVHYATRMRVWCSEGPIYCFPLLYNIDTLDDKDLPLCVPNGLETAIHWIQWRHCSCKKWRTHLVKATRDILDVVFVQKLFCSVYYCLSVHIFFEVAEKNYLIWDFFQRSIWLQRHAIEKPFGFATLRVVSWLESNGGGQWV